MNDDDDVWYSCDDGLRREEMRNPIPLKYFKFSTPLSSSVKYSKVKNTWDAVIPSEWLQAEFPEEETRPTVIRFGEFCSNISTTPIAQIPYLIMVSKFFKNKEMIDRYLTPFLKRSIDVSLCNIDWLLTNYSKEMCLGYYVVRDDEQTYSCLKKEYIVLNGLYTKTLNMYRRRHFGSFRRSNRCWVRESRMETTVGQLIFLIWCVEWRVFDCARILLDQIESHKTMKTENNKKEILEFKQRGLKRPRKELVEEPRSFPIIVKIEN
jgi:hypothetical protein